MSVFLGEDGLPLEAWVVGRNVDCLRGDGGVKLGVVAFDEAETSLLVEATFNPPGRIRL